MSDTSMTAITPLKKFAVLGVASIFALTACGEAADGDNDDDAAAQTENGEDLDEQGDQDGDEGSSDSIAIAGVPAEDASALEERFDLFLNILEDETGLPAEITIATDYNAVIESLIAGQADMAWGSPFSYVRAADQGAPVEPLGGNVTEEGEEPGYVAYAVVPAGSDIESLEDVDGGTVCYVDQGSTSGYLYPSAGMLEAGIEPMDDVEALFTGSHDGAVLALLDGQCDLAFAYDEMVDTLLPQRGEIEEGDVEVIWESPNIPASPIYMNTDTLDEDTQETLRTIFNDNLINVDNLVEAGYCDSADECDLPEEAYEFAPIDDSDYDGIREVCDVTEAEACS